MWDLPEKVSCYGQSEIVLVIFYMENGRNRSESYVASGTNTFFDILGRTASTDYLVSLDMRVVGGMLLSDGINLAVRTGK